MKKQKIILTKGISASGKSTWAKGLVQQEPGKWKRINKDDLREMLDASKHTKGNEKFVLTIRDGLIDQSLNEGYSVIVDDTNLNPIHEKTIREKFGERAEIEIKEFKIDLSEAIERDLNRPKSVGETVIKRQFREYIGGVEKRQVQQKIRESHLPTVILCDLDGTLCLPTNRSPYDSDNCESDELNFPVAVVLHKFHRYGTQDLIFCSGREEKSRPPTERWLHKHGIDFYKGLYMRKTGDFRKDAVIKKEMYEEHIEGKYNVLFILDDRSIVVDLWRSLGLTCFQVAPGDF